MSEIITSSGNPLLKKIRSLRQAKTRKETGLFLVEGIHPVGEAAEAGWDFDSLVYAPDLLTSEYAKALIEKLSLEGVHCVPIQNALFSSIVDKENPQGILGVVRKKHASLDQIQIKKSSLVLALVSPQDPGNIGTILRTIDSVGADGLMLINGGADPFHPTAVRASMGSLFWIPVIETYFNTCLDWAHENQFFVVGTSAHAATDYQELPAFQKPVIVFLGNEQKGLSSEQMEKCDITISIPMRGRSSSLNLAVAAGILLYHLKRE
jgi:RNA methyltransferase, TrmH family